MKNILEKFNISDLPKKQWWFTVIFLLSGIVFWISLFSIFSNNTSATVTSAIGVIWLTFVTLGMLFLNKRLLFLTYTIFGILVFILFGFGVFNLIGVGIFWLLTLLAHKRADKTREILLEFKISYITRKFLPIFLTGLALVVAFIWQGFILEKDLQEAPQITQETFHKMFAPIEGTIAGIVPGYRSGMTIEEFQNLFFGGFGSGQNGAQQEILQQTLEEFTLVWVNSSINATLTPYLGLAPFFVILGLFFVLKFIFWYLKWISLGLLLLATKLMKIYNILIIKEEQIVRSVPVLE